MPFNPDKLAKLVGKGPTTVRTGGKGSVRRKHKVVRKTATHDDKRLKATLNKLSVRDIPAIEEVNLFKDDGTVIHFVNPKVSRQHSTERIAAVREQRQAGTRGLAVAGLSGWDTPTDCLSERGCPPRAPARIVRDHSHACRVPAAV